MRCPDCGTENDLTQNRCRKCGKPLTHSRAKGAGQLSNGSTCSPVEVARHFKNEYMRVSNDQADRTVEVVQEMCELILKQEIDSGDLVSHAAKLIFRQCHIREVAIGLRSASDGRYRYAGMQGMRTNIWAEHQGLSYDKESFNDNKKYKGTLISRYTKLLLAEDEPYDEQEKRTYSEHLMLSSSRNAPDDSIEGDYIDIVIFGPSNEILGWIEISGTWENKLPSARTVKTLEAIASLLGIAFARDPAILGKT